MLLSKLAESLFNSLPQELRGIYNDSPKRGSIAQLLMKLIVARHLWGLGFRQIAFERSFILPSGEVVIVDVYAGEERLCIECETSPRRSDVRNRIERLRTADPIAKHVLAVPDYLGYEAGRFERLTEVWVVCRDGRVLKPKEWVEWRRNYLLEAADARKLAVLIKCYREKREFVKHERMLEKRLLLMLSGCMSAIAVSVAGYSSWLSGQPMEWSLSRITDFSESLMEDIRFELLADIVELTNRVITLTTPYRLRLKSDGVVVAETDLDALEWLGESDAPADAKNARKRAKQLKTMLMEMEMLSKTIKPKVQECLKAMEYPIYELLEIIRKGKITINNVGLLEKLGLTKSS